MSRDDKILVLTGISSVIVFVIFYTAAGFAFGQTEQTSPTAATTTSQIPLTEPARQIITEVQNQCTQETGNPLNAILCVSVVHESPNTVVLDGQLLLSEGAAGYVDNPFIWRAVDGFRNQGYTVIAAELSGQGSVGNPHGWNIVMSK